MGFYTLIFRQTDWMPYLGFTKLNLYLDLLSDILLKAFDKRKQIEQVV